MSITLIKDELDKWLGKNIKDICECEFINNNVNHCAHFVAHALQFTFGYTCRQQTGKGGTGATIRVNEIFNRCTDVGLWDKRPTQLDQTGCLIFVTGRNNVSLETKFMTDHPKKHIGIYHDGSIWHYSNSKDKVIQALPSDFRRHYPTVADLGLFYGAFPV